MNVNVPNAHPRVKCAISSSKNKEFFWYVTKPFLILKRPKNHFKNLLEIYIVSEGKTQDKSVSLSMHRKDIDKKFYEFGKNLACCHVFQFLFGDQGPTFMLFGGDGTDCFVKKTNRDYEIEKQPLFLKKFIQQTQLATPEYLPKKAKSLHFWENRVDSPRADTVNQKMFSIFISHVFSLRYRNMIFAVSNDDSEISLAFWPDSVILTVQDVVQEMT